MAASARTELLGWSDFLSHPAAQELSIVRKLLVLSKDIRSSAQAALQGRVTVRMHLRYRWEAVSLMRWLSENSALIRSLAVSTKPLQSEIDDVRKSYDWPARRQPRYGGPGPRCYASEGLLEAARDRMHLLAGVVVRYAAAAGGYRVDNNNVSNSEEDHCDSHEHDDEYSAWVPTDAAKVLNALNALEAAGLVVSVPLLLDALPKNDNATMFIAACRFAKQRYPLLDLQPVAEHAHDLSKEKLVSLLCTEFNCEAILGYDSENESDDW